MRTTTFFCIVTTLIQVNIIIISLRFVKEIGRLGGDISQFVSPQVKKILDVRFEEERNGLRPLD